MFTFPFFCPICQEMTNATADPVGLLFGGAPDLKLTCGECESVFRSEVTVNHDVIVGDRLSADDSE